MFKDRLKQARVASSLSMRKLAEEVGVSANMIKKYEHGLSMPSSDVLVKLAKALNVKSEYFFRPMALPLSKINFRKKSNTPKYVLEKVKGDVIDQGERWVELKNLWPNFPINLPEIKKIEIKEYDDIEKLTLSIRNQWNIGMDPIENLISLVEEQGFIVIISKVEAEQGVIDGLLAYLDNIPLIVSQQKEDGVRQRFTIAHELGHFFLSGMCSSNLNEEVCCHRFAQSFLFPELPFKKAIGEKRSTLSWEELYLLKQQWKISIQAIIRRSYDLQIINKSTYTNLFRELSQKGWRKKEPGDLLKTEEATLFKRLVYRALSENIIGVSKAAELLGESVKEIYNKSV